MKKKMITFLGFMSIGVFSWHTTLTIQYFLGQTTDNIGMNISGFALVFFLTVHMALALTNMIKNAKRTGYEKFYMKYIWAHSMQNVSGICIFGFAILHALFFELHKAFGTEVLLIAWLISDILFYLCVCIHLGIGVPHILISYGIVTNRKIYSTIKGILVFISVALCVLLIYSQTVFTFNHL